MAIIKRHSYNPKRINRYKIKNLLNKTSIISLWGKTWYRSYMNGIKEGAIFDYIEGDENSFIARIHKNLYDTFPHEYYLRNG